VGKQRVQKLMNLHGIRTKGKRRFKVTTDNNHKLPILASSASISPLWSGAATSRRPSALRNPQRADRRGPIPHNGMVTFRIWQANIGKTIVAHVSITDGQPGAGNRRFRVGRRDLSGRR
jgi:hypothetical protein